MHSKLSTFCEILDRESRYEALIFIKSLLDSKEMSLFEVYEDLLTPALNQMIPTGDENVDIWNEHIRTSIVKTILENLYPYVLAARQDLPESHKKQVVILTPPDEYHSLGARMVKDAFTALGYHAIYVGGNTPFRVLKAGLISRPIDYVAISISNPYHLISARNMIQDIRQTSPSIIIIVGGSAISRLGSKVSALQADYVITRFQDLLQLTGGQHETSL